MTGRSNAQNKPVAIVTGSSRGIGRSIAIRLATEGYRVVVNFLSSKDAAMEVAGTIRSVGGEVMVVRADVSSPDDVAALVDGAARRFGGIDVVVSNAAAGGFRPLSQTTAVNLSATIACNAMPAVHLAVAAADHLATTSDRHPDRRHGKFVAISSHGSRWAVPNYGAIGASKAALESYVRHLALEIGDRGINFNCVLPGIIGTEAVASMPGVENVIGSAQRRMMVGDRTLTEDDVAGVVTFLCGGQSDFIQGQTIVVDGGVSVRV